MATEQSIDRPATFDRPAWRFPSSGNTLTRGIVCSFLVHLCLLAYGGGVWISAGSSPVGRPTAIAVRPATSTGERHVPVDVATIPAPEQDPGGVDASTVEDRLDTLVDRLAEVPREENLRRLDDIEEQLERVASTHSVDEIAERFQTWFNYEPRAETPAAQPGDDEFDFDSAQLHDVELNGGVGESATYIAILIDAAGRTQRVPLGEAEGKTIYDLMQRIKSNPLMEKIYRRIAMPMLDRLLQRAGGVPDQGQP